MPDQRVRVNLSDINTRFNKGSLPAYGASYIVGGEIDTRTGLGLAIGAIFGPLQAAIEGLSSEEIERYISSADRTSKTYWAMAREIAVENCSVLETLHDKGTETKSQIQNADEILDLDEEEL